MCKSGRLHGYVEVEGARVTEGWGYEVGCERVELWAVPLDCYWKGGIGVGDCESSVSVGHSNNLDGDGVEGSSIVTGNDQYPDCFSRIEPKMEIIAPVEYRDCKG